MNSPEDDDPDVHPDELFDREEIALVDARARVAFSEHELARLAKTYPEIAALRLPVSEYTVADLRTDELKDVLGRINAALGLTGEEPEFWMRLWEYALEKRWVDEDEFDGMTREELADRIDAGLPTLQGAVEPTGSVPAPEDPDITPDNTPVATPPLPNQQRNRWARSRSPHAENLHASIRRMKAEGLSQLQMCERLDAQKLRPPFQVSWGHLTWRAAYMSEEYNGTVKKWISKVTVVTP